MSSSTATTNPPTDSDHEAAPDCVLRILSGLHAGASRTLAEREMILVGSGEDCDIVLADQGVARHHALINLVAGMSSLRALDAPLRVDGVPLHPGDPVELRGLQRIQLGDAAIAFGAEGDPRWAALLPMASGAPGTARAGPGLKRLPTIAALAVLSLASLAIFAAVMPPKETEPEPDVSLASLIRDYRIGDGAVSENVNGDPVLTGTVADAATRERIGKRLQDAGITATLDLRTGEDIAADVSEVLRSQGVNARTRYLGNGVVEASGRFEDMEALRTAAQSRAMHEVDGVDKVLPKNSIEPGATRTARAGSAPAATAAVRIVSVVRGDEPHLVDVDGVEYPVGAEVPGLGKLVSIGTAAHVISADGMLHKVLPKPVTAAELAAAAEAQVAAEVATQRTTTKEKAASPTTGSSKQAVARRAASDNGKQM